MSLTTEERREKVLEVRARMIEDRNKRNGVKSTSQKNIVKKAWPTTITHTQKKTQNTVKKHIYNDNDSDEYHDFKNEVYAKDNCTCQKCGAKRHLQVHHIENYYDNPNKAMNTANGTLLCKECHEDFHGIYGGRYNTRTQFNKFMK